MLDQLVNFIDEIDSDSITISVSKVRDTVFLQTPKTPGVVFKISQIRQSKGGILNDRTAQEILNEQLTGRSGSKGSPRDCKSPASAM